MNWPKITPADITWKNGATPVSKTFDDVYFMPGKGLDEKKYVFQEGINLDDLLAKTPHLAIAELGFGTGLNFLLTWQRARDRKTRLDYVAFEGFPLTQGNLKTALDGTLGQTQNLLPELDSACYQLVTSWPPLIAGAHRLHFDEGRVTLTLVFGEVLPSLKEIDGVFDGWYLDGFSPDKNPEMWSPEVFREIARLSGQGTRLATYSAAGNVRRGLEAAGFSITKRKGFEKKRESLTATFDGPEKPRGLASGSKIAIVGGGIAGCSAAFALKQKGFEVTLFEKENQLAAGTSGHPLAVFKPRLQKSYDPYGAFYLSAYLYSLSLFESLEEKFGGIWHPIRGIFQNAADLEEADNLETLSKLFPALSDHFDFTEDGLGLRFKKAGCLVPRNICRALTKDIEVVLGHEYKGDVGFDATVLATGQQAFAGWGESPFRLTRGQINYLPGKKGIEMAETLSFPGGYLTPATAEGFHILGTSFEVWQDPGSQGWKALSQENFEENLAALKKNYPQLAGQWENPELLGRTALRCETLDHLPVVGAAFDKEKFVRVFKDKQRLHHSQRVVKREADIPGLFVFSGFGSRGFMAAPYAAEILTSRIAGTPPPCPRPISRALDPARFLLKDLKTGKIRGS